MSFLKIQLVEKTREHFLFTAHQEILIQYVENNLTIIYCKNGDFSQSEQSYKFFQFFRKSGVVNSISEKKNVKIFFRTHQNSFIHSVENNLTIILL